MIRDLHSKNGTFVNHQKIEDTQLHPGDQLNFGSVTFVIQIDGTPAKEAITPLTPAAPAKQPEQPKQEDHFEQFNDELSDLHPGSSHTAEIPDIINDDLAAQA
jgi:pSer/pThr/pTyr-binding forkhead associated (FHA) protein